MCVRGGGRGEWVEKGKGHVWGREMNRMGLVNGGCACVYM